MNLYMISAHGWGLDFRLVVASNEDEAFQIEGIDRKNPYYLATTIEFLSAGVPGPARKLWNYETSPDTPWED